MKNKKILVITIRIVVGLIIFFIGFFIGNISSNSSKKNIPSNFNGRQLGARSVNGGGFASGKIESKDTQSIVLQLPNGNSEVVFYSSSTQVIKPSQASLNDISIGSQVMVGGTQNSDGSLTAQSIQIVPQNSSAQLGSRFNGQ